MRKLLSHIRFEEVLIFFLCVVSILTTLYLYNNNYLLLYGDAESHLNISKRITGSITPGLAQLGGIWLPLPHLLMVPFTALDSMWRSGLAGSVVSGISFVIASFYIYKLLYLVTKHKPSATIGMLSFSLNPNILYLQGTAMTELLLIAFFVLSSYHFLKFLQNEDHVLYLIYAAFFGFCATLSRYDGWFLVFIETFILVVFYARKLFYAKHSFSDLLKGDIGARANLKKVWHTMEGKLLLFSVLAFVGIGMWLLWNWIILNDPIYFTNSPFSAKSQQKGWLARGELPTYHNLPLSYIYYLVTSIVNIGYAFSGLALSGLVLFLLDSKQKERLYIAALFSVPFVFYVLTLYMGQSVIFIPQVTPSSFTWNLFNVRYGVMMIPAAAFFIGYVFSEIIHFPYRKHVPFLSRLVQVSLVSLFMFFAYIQFSRFVEGKEKVISFEDGRSGLSSSKTSDAELWLKENYDGGLLLMDDYSRTISVIKSGVPMQNVIYIGNKPYWEESLSEPEKHAEWIAMQKNDAVWRELQDNPEKEGRLYKYFEKAYTSPEILIFKRNNEVLAGQ
jgi:hypothetical protein